MPAFLTLPLATLVLASDIAIALFVLLSIASVFSAPARRLRDTLLARVSKYALAFAFVVALVSTLGSLYFSEVAHYEPCRLCWFQRIFMYPQAILLGMAFFRKDNKIFSYAVPLSVIGGMISAYHYYIQVKAAVTASTASSCSATGVSCASTPFFSYGYITIPFMALTGFALILIAAYISRRATATKKVLISSN